MFKDKILLVTGGTGSFGNTIVNRFLKTDIREYVQYALYQKEGELPNEAWLTYQMRTAAYLAERIFTMYVFHQLNRHYKSTTLNYLTCNSP